MRIILACLISICATAVHAQVSLARYFDENSLPLLDLNDHLPVNFKWDQKGPVQAALNEGLNFLDENKLELSIANLSEAISLDTNLWVAYYYRGIAHKKNGEVKEAEKDILHAKKIKTNQSEVCFELGELYHQQGKYTQAQKLYEEAIQLNPNLVDAYFNLGSLQFMQADIRKALKYYKKCNEVNPRFAKAYVMEGLLKFRETKTNGESIDFFTKAIQMDSSYSLSYFWRGMFYIYSNQNEKCLDDWTHFIAFNPGNVFMLSMRGYLYIELNRFEEAFVDLKKVLLSRDIDEESFKGTQTLLDKQIDTQALARYIMRNGYGLSDEAFSFVKKGFCLLLSGKKSEALESAKRAEGLTQAATIYYLEALILENQDDHTQALKYYDLALKLDNDIFDAHKKRGIYRTEMKNWSGAFVDFNDMIRLQPETIMTYRLRGLAKANRKDYYGAIIDISKYVKSDTTDVEAFTTRGVCRYQVKDIKGGIEDFRKALSMDSLNSILHFNVVEGYVSLADTAEAIRAIQNFIRLMPSQIYPHLKLAEIHITRHEWNPAIEQIEGVTQGFNSFYNITNKDVRLWAYHLRGIVSFRQGQYKAAIGYFDKALEASPNNQESLYYLGKAYKFNGDVRKAINALEKLGDKPFKDSHAILLSLQQSK